MGELVFVCPWPVWVSLARRSEEAEPDEGSQGEERVPALPLPSWGMGDLPLAFFAQMWTLRPGLTCLFKVAEPRFELGAPVPDSLGQKRPLARCLRPCPLITSRPSALHPHPHSSPERHS